MKDTKSNKKRNAKKASVSKKSVETVSFKKTGHLNNKIHFSYEKRMIVYIVLFIVLFALGFFFAGKILTKEDTEPINYTEKELIDYKVYLKDNDFYTEEYLPKDRAYIASLIDYIDIDLKFIFSIERLTTMNVNYKVIGELVIENANGSNKYYDREYTILDTKNKKMKGINEFTIDETIKIGYDYYNELANRFRSSYGVDTNSYLKIYMIIDKETDSSLNYAIKETSKVDNIIIPLSQRAIEIKINSSSNSSSKFVIPKPLIKINTPYLIAEIVSFLIVVFSLAKMVKYVMIIFKKRTIYDKYVSRLLREYDRLIIEIKTDVDLSKYNIIEVNRFNELLDVRDNIKMPINYYNIAKHEKGIFYIKNNDDIYLLTLKNIDLESKKYNEI